MIRLHHCKLLPFLTVSFVNISDAFSTDFNDSAELLKMDILRGGVFDDFSSVSDERRDELFSSTNTNFRFFVFSFILKIEEKINGLTS